MSWWAFQGHFNKVNILLHFTAILQLQCFQVPTTKIVWSEMPTILEIGNYWDSHFLPHEKLFIYCIDKTSDSMFQRVVTLSSFDQDWWWNSIVQFMDVHIILQLIVADTWKTRADAVLLLWLLKHLSQKTVFLGASPTQMIPSRQVLTSDMLRKCCTLYDGKFHSICCYQN